MKSSPKSIDFETPKIVDRKQRELEALQDDSVHSSILIFKGHLKNNNI